jgi:hypothetical protein
MPRLASGISYPYHIGIDCPQLFQLPRVPGLRKMQKSYFGDFMVLKRAVGMGIIASPEMKKNANNLK